MGMLQPANLLFLQVPESDFADFLRKADEFIDRYPEILDAIEEDLDAVSGWTDVETRATAIRIGKPVNAPKALPAIRETGGTAVAVADEEITDAQRALAEDGIGVEPASAASVAGLQKLNAEGRIDDYEQVVCLTTGHLLKDPDAAATAGGEPEPVPNSVEGVLETLS